MSLDSAYYISGKITEENITFAKLRNGSFVSIDDVPSGLACNCICVECNKPLIARKGLIRIPHFAHSSNEHGLCSASGCYMTLLHQLSEQIIKNNKCVMLPGFCDVIPPKKIEFVKVEVEERNDRTDYQPDIVGITEDGVRYVIEIKNTNGIKEDRRKKIEENDLICLEIDVSKIKLDCLEKFLLEEIKSRYWINNPYYYKEVFDYYESKEGCSLKAVSKYHCNKKCFGTKNCEYIVASILNANCHEINLCKNNLVLQGLNPFEEKKKTTEREFKKNIFADSRKKAERNNSFSYIDKPLPLSKPKSGEPSLYPSCPKTITQNPLNDYYSNLYVSKPFFDNGTTRTDILDFRLDGEKLYVVHASSSFSEGVKYYLTCITFNSDDKCFYYQRYGKSYYKKELEALNEMRILVGEEVINGSW